MHKVFEGRGGEDYIVKTTVINPAGHIHVTDKNPSGPQAFRGYGGSMLRFELEDGTVREVKGPWHTNSAAFLAETGILITDLHLTRLTIRDNDHNGKILYEEKEPVLGPFMRGERIVQQLANLLERPLYCERESEGGSSKHTCFPDKKPHTMAMRGRNDEVWKEITE